ncbi:LPS O-antigen chain length determinant protein WzzB [Trabulsiella odontotermitis]|uniref:LPS O-antigen chain length determinant protein WzzB n=1 Tax=Trabulsiella odontotermitis TaxID=379893 RepID=UPI0024B71323|nr:LPS O-antigen chain length determinant protein WzzB [Trabulsiella odontotermitis]WHP29866.1 LPS O-antigen chain length determinant protein WzzB [Trabulsiella odontotermitis]
MTQDNNNGTDARRVDSEQIDLIDVVIQLWRGKVTIGVCIIIAILVAAGYLFIAKEKWTSTAIITQPDTAQIATYSNALNILYGNAAPNVTDLQTRVVDRFNSAFSALAESLNNQEKPEKLAIEPVVKTEKVPLQITYQGQTAEGAQQQLAKYIQQVDEQIAKEIDVDLKDNITLQIGTLSDSLETQEKVAQEQKDLRIKQIQEALKFAEQANITKPQVQQTQDVTQDTMFLLGSDALNSMIQNESTRPLVFSPAYFQTKQTLLDIQNLKVDPTTIHAYRYVMKPDLPVYRDSPKRALTLVLAVLLGGMIGAGVVLGRNAVRSYRPKQ